MRINTKRARDLMALIRKAGAASAVYLGVTGGVHLGFLVHAANGASRKFFMGFTPSDWRADKNNLALVRSFLRQNAAGVPA